ncbi:MAG: sulfite exporter TauE/SafE family protein [Bacteroidetes bacterium]|nr:sulfite exporter TauE/SafE family protein [Bacteroidota bacterium]
MHIVGYLASLLIGLTLGLIGGGGSILTMPVLVYFFAVSPVLATSYSLFVVGTTSLAGSISYYRNRHTNGKVAALFGVSSIVTVYITRKYIVHSLPENLFSIGDFVVTESLFTMLLFALLMILASLSMIRSRKKDKDAIEVRKNYSFFQLSVYGVFIGLITGLLGAGGGFLLIPALVLLIGLPMKEAVGTSLLIITLNSVIGFLSDLGHFRIDWTALLTITAIAVCGMFIGISVSKKVNGAQLKTGFGWFVMFMGVYIIIKELFIH